jgi:hypothetical protein
MIAKVVRQQHKQRLAGVAARQCVEMIGGAARARIHEHRAFRPDNGINHATVAQPKHAIPNRLPGKHLSALLAVSDERTRHQQRRPRIYTRPGASSKPTNTGSGAGPRRMLAHGRPGFSRIQAEHIPRPSRRRDSVSASVCLDEIATGPRR